jgi:hypothetical protein
VEALQLTQSHWSSGSTVCFPLTRAAGCALVMHPHLQWNRVLLLAMSCYIGDPNIIDHLPCCRPDASLGRCADNVKNQCDLTMLLPRFHSAPCRSSSSSQHIDRSSCWGEPFGGPAVSPQYTVSLVQCVNRLLPT